MASKSWLTKTAAPAFNESSFQISFLQSFLKSTKNSPDKSEERQYFVKESARAKNDGSTLILDNLSYFRDKSLQSRKTIRFNNERQMMEIQNKFPKSLYI
jgi:hypothetical protein